jgi:hypothetical protein
MIGQHHNFVTQTMYYKEYVLRAFRCNSSHVLPKPACKLPLLSEGYRWKKKTYVSNSLREGNEEVSENRVSTGVTHKRALQTALPNAFGDESSCNIKAEESNGSMKMNSL